MFGGVALGRGVAADRPRAGLLEAAEQQHARRAHGEGRALLRCVEGVNDNAVAGTL